MEWLNQNPIHTAPLHLRPRLGSCYVDDILELVKKDTTKVLRGGSMVNCPKILVCYQR